MNTGEKIYLSIFGNPVRSTGFKVLLSGACPFSMEYEGYYGINKAPYAFVVKVYERFTLFKLSCNHVTTSDGHTGTLIFAISIPARHKIEGNKTPYDLLMAVRGEFILKYMYATPGALVEESYMFKPITNLIDELEFASILQEYPLVQIPRPHHPMWGTEPAILQLNEEQMRQLFSDINCYEELTRYKEVIVAQNVDASYYQDRDLTGKIEIPRKRKFVITSNNQVNIFVSDILMASVVNQYTINEDDFDKTITVISFEEPEYHHPDSVSFSVDELLHERIPDKVMINPVEGVIRCLVKGREKEETINIKLRLLDGDDISQAGLMKYIVVSLNNQQLNITNGQFTLRGMQLKDKSLAGPLIISIDKSSQYEITNLDWEDSSHKTIIVELKSILISDNLTTMETLGGGVNSVGRSNSSSGAQRQQGEIKLKIKIYNANDFLDSTGALRVKIATIAEGNGEPDLRFEQRTVFRRDKTERSLETHMAELLLTPVWKGKKVELFVENSKRITKEINVLLKQDNEVKVDVSDTTSIGHFKQKSVSISLFITPILFFLCLILVYFLIDAKSSGNAKKCEVGKVKLIAKNDSLKIVELEKEIKDLKLQLQSLKDAQNITEVQIKKNGEINNGENNKTEIDTWLESVNKMLQKEDLKFEDVIKKYAEFKDKRINSKSLDNSHKALIAKLEAYNNISTILMESDTAKLKKLNDKSPEIELLSDDHRRCVLYIYCGDFSTNPPRRYTQTGVTGGAQWGLNVYRQSKQGYKSFKALEAFNKKNKKEERKYEQDTM